MHFIIPPVCMIWSTRHLWHKWLDRRFFASRFMFVRLDKFFLMTEYNFWVTVLQRALNFTFGTILCKRSAKHSQKLDCIGYQVDHRTLAILIANWNKSETCVFSACTVQVVISTEPFNFRTGSLRSTLDHSIIGSNSTGYLLHGICSHDENLIS